MARARRVNPLVPGIEEMTAAYGVLVLLLGVVLPLTLRRRPDCEGWKRWLPVHLGGLLVFTVAHTSWNWATRAALFPLFGLGRYDYGSMPVRYFMEFPSDVIVYTMLAGAVVYRARSLESRERDLRIAHLENDLAKAQIEALALQLQPPLPVQRAERSIGGDL